MANNASKHSREVQRRRAASDIARWKIIIANYAGKVQALEDQFRSEFGEDPTPYVEAMLVRQATKTAHQVAAAAAPLVPLPASPAPTGRAGDTLPQPLRLCLHPGFKHGETCTICRGEVKRGASA